MASTQDFRGNAYRKLPELDAWTSQRHETALEPDLPIVDPHHHLWDDERRGRYLIDALSRDIDSGHNIIATVFIEVGAMYRADGPTAEQPIGEVEFVNGVAAMSASGRYGKSRLCAGIVGHVDLTLGDRTQPILQELIAAGNGRLCGIRHGAHWDGGNAAHGSRRQVPRHLILAPEFRRGLECLQPFGLSFDASLLHPQLPDLVELLRALPNLNVILDHAGGLLGIPPYDKREQIFPIWQNQVRELAQFPNLSVKVGGFGVPRCGWDFHLREIPPSSEELANAWRPYVETCIETFGVHRCMMESNFPVDKQSCSYGVLWNAMKRITRHYSASEKAALYRDTAVRIYRLTI